MLTIINIGDEPELLTLTDLVKNVAEESYQFDDHKITTYVEPTPALFPMTKAAMFPDKKVVDIKFNKTVYQSLEGIISKGVKAGRSGRILTQTQTQTQLTPSETILLRIGLALCYSTDRHVKGLPLNREEYQGLIYRQGDTDYLSAYTGFLRGADISENILHIPIIHLFLAGNTPHYEYYISHGEDIIKGIITFFLSHEVGHTRISPMDQKTLALLNQAASEVVTPLNPLKTNYSNLFTDMIVNISNMLNGVSKEYFTLGFNATYQFELSANSVNNAFPSISNLVFLDVMSRLGQQKGGIPTWVEDMFPNEYEFVKPLSLKISRSLAEDSDLAQRLYTQTASHEDIALFYKKLRNPATWQSKIKFLTATLNNYTEPSNIKRKSINDSYIPGIPLVWINPEDEQEDNNKINFSEYISPLSLQQLYQLTLSTSKSTNNTSNINNESIFKIYSSWEINPGKKRVYQTDSNQDTKNLFSNNDTNKKYASQKSSTTTINSKEVDTSKFQRCLYKVLNDLCLEYDVRRELDSTVDETFVRSDLYYFMEYLGSDTQIGIIKFGLLGYGIGSMIEEIIEGGDILNEQEYLQQAKRYRTLQELLDNELKKP